MRKLCLMLVLLFMISLCACDSKSSSPSGVSSPPNNAESQNGEVAQADDDRVGIDDVINGDCFDISIVDAIWTDELEFSVGTIGSSITPQNEGTKLLCLIFSAQNTTEETKNLGMFNAYVDNEAALQTVIGGNIDGAMPFVGAVESGMSMKAYAIWELSEDWEELQLNYFEATGPECKQHFVIQRENIE